MIFTGVFVKDAHGMLTDPSIKGSRAGKQDSNFWVKNEAIPALLNYSKGKEAMKLPLKSNEELKAEFIFAAVSAGNVALIEVFLGIGKNFNLDVTDEKRNSLLHIAVTEGHIDMVAFLISKGLVFDCINRAEQTPKDIAIAANNAEIVELLERSERAAEEKKAALLSYNRVLKISHLKIGSDIAKDLIAGAGKNAYLPEEELIKFNPEQMCWMFKKLADKSLNEIDLIYVLKHFKEVLDLNSLNDSLVTACFLDCIELDRIEVVKLLIRMRANVNYIDKNGVSPLEKAVSRLDFDMIDYLVDNGAELNIRGSNGESLAFSFLGDTLLLKHLLGKGLNPNFVGKIGNSLLEKAVMRNNVDMVRLLLEKGANPLLCMEHLTAATSEIVELLDKAKRERVERRLN